MDIYIYTYYYNNSENGQYSWYSYQGWCADTP